MNERGDRVEERMEEKVEGALELDKWSLHRMYTFAVSLTHTS